MHNYAALLPALKFTTERWRRHHVTRLSPLKTAPAVQTPTGVYTLPAAALSAGRPSPAIHPAAPFLGASQRISASGPCNRAIHSDREPGLLGAAAARLSPTSKQPVHVGRVAPDPSPGVVYVGQRFLFLVHEGALQNGVRSPYTTRISGKIAMCV